MKDCCDLSNGQTPPGDSSYRKVLWLCLAVNALMFATEIVAGLLAGSLSLQADALDFLGDAANYGISLYVLGRSIRLRAYSSLIKSATMLAFGIWILVQAGYKILNGIPPEADVMGVIGFLALLANVFCFVILSRHSRDDSNRMSVWLCSRNDALGNVAVMIAAVATHFTQSFWPDLLVAIIMAMLAFSSSYRVIGKAIYELRAS